MPTPTTAGAFSAAAAASTTLLENDHGVTAIRVKVDATSAAALEVHVVGLHDTDEYDRIEPGETVPYRLYDGEIRRVVGRGVGGTATGRIAAMSRTWRNMS